MDRSYSLGELFVTTWPVIFAFDLAKYLVAAGLLAAILALFGQSLASRRIQLRRSGTANIRREISYSLLTALLFSLVGFTVLLGSRAGILRVYEGDVPEVVWLVLEFAAVIVLHDAYFYWAHRALHHRKLLRRVHRIHHLSVTPTPWAAYAFAPLEALVQGAFLPLAAVLVPMHELTVNAFVLHMVVRNVIGHAGIELFPSWWLNVPVLRAITTATHHDLHHLRGSHNFGLYFTWWDRWMKTEHPEYRARFEKVVRRG